MRLAGIIAVAVLGVTLAAAQQPAAPPQTYQPKSASDKARSEAEFGALAYMRTVAAAEKAYYRKHNQYAPSLAALVGSLSFTRRMANPKRGDYTVAYKPSKNGYSLSLTPQQFDTEHRSFYMDESGEFRADDSKRATAASPLLK